MKIALVCPYNIAYGGGVQELIVAVRAGLAARGHEAYIITAEPKEYDPAIVKKNNIIFIGTSSDFKSPTHTTIQVSSGLAEQIDSVLDKFKFDIINFHEPWVPVLGRQIIIRSRSANVATTHATLPDTRMSRTVVKMVTPYARSILKYVDAFTAVSEPASHYLQSMGVSEIEIIPNGIDLQAFQAPASRQVKSNLKEILFVGRLENRKGCEYLLQALALVVREHPGVRLKIIGKGPDRQKLEAEAADLGISDFVEFLGYVDNERKIQLMHEADLYCSPALYGESQGIVLLEAMAAGLVTVAGDNPGYSSLMTGLGGLSLVNPLDTPQFAQRLELLLYQEDLRELWRDWAKSKIPSYDFQIITDRYEAVYKRVLERPTLKYQINETRSLRARAQRTKAKYQRYSEVS